MVPRRVPYTAIRRASAEEAGVHFAVQDDSDAADVEDNELFDMSRRSSTALEVSDNDTLYYGVTLGARSRTRKSRLFWATVVSLVCVSVVGMFWFYFNGINWIQRSKKRNVILMISDGFGPASETMARNYMQRTRNFTISYQSPLDEILVGSSRTRSSDSLITDSAAGATAFSCQMKSYNGAIGVDDKKTPCGTVLEAAKLQRGMATGLVATSRITHATPAAFSSHATSRNMEDLIAEYQIGNYSLGPMVDLMFGGGQCHFVGSSQPNGMQSCRLDDRDLWGEAQKNGYTTLASRKEFDVLDSRNAHLLPLLGTFASSHMDYEIDRDPKVQPSLAEMAGKALEILGHATHKKNAGFFLMIEGSRIDMAAHTNDPAAHVRDILAYWDAVSVVRKFVDKNPDTVLISVSDHETGGFSVAKQLTSEYPEYLWNPYALEPVKHSIEYISYQLLPHQPDTSAGNGDDDRYKMVRDKVFSEWMGINDATHEEILAVARETDSVNLRQLLSNAISNRAQLGWATHGHSAVDVNLYAYGKDADLLRGNHENTDIGDFIVQALGLDLAAVTSKIRAERVVQSTQAVKETWLGRRRGMEDLDAPEHNH
ncbi:vacuolar alkaline phosphatase [Coemansia sp. RSA 1813]|nr:vacuolar alkaline phosphatase [Coemansia sp. RSA 1646]KAJ1772263.1 vacuolar alkaline phosphatase [Coemansia sp. RSA 1843]KAJ2091895.1 vacuolar alkaline phosphatase [Coemansia sp. RSA 986]KAJ2215779.1 vacuolar alkaline phosphatase [Coemansia sp. RSA 487]KAJ2571710.1 vacuolar alkaline phosphatase [Coemansia sp. RSA 1813]